MRYNFVYLQRLDTIDRACSRDEARDVGARSPYAISKNQMAGRLKAARALATVCILCSSSILFAGDWPQILGPNRNGVAVDETLAERWSAGGPDVVWKQPIGSGYAGPAVVADLVFVFHRVGEKERIDARSTKDGSIQWQVDFAASYRGGVNPDDGPRCVPLVVGNRVICFGAAGDLHCVDRRSGQKLWSRQLWDDYDASEGYFGAGSCPIVIGDRVIVNVGGKDKAGFVAVDIDNGKTIWNSVRQDASYSSPIALSTTGGDRIAAVARLELLLIDPANGEVTASYPFGKRGPTVNAANPVAFDDKVFVTASYRIGAALLRTDGNRLEVVWSNDRSLSSQYNTPVLSDGFLYGIHGREDAGLADLRCVSADTGKVQWSRPDFGVAHLIQAGDRLLALTADGKLVLFKRAAAKFSQLGEAKVSTATTRAQPALSNGKLFFRENVGKTGTLLCLHVGP